jgi:ABC-2 type transport system permease protein
VIINTALVITVLELEDFPLSLDDTDVMRVIVGGVVFLTLAALFGLGVGLIANSQTLGITIGILWPTALETSLQAFLPDWVERLLPFEAGAAMLAVPANPDLPPWEGAGVFLLWAAGLVIVGGILFKKRDLGSS